nr:hypothetical protein [Tanacetum cinerariifolium]
EGNKSIQCSDKQRNLYKALVKAYESDKIILDTYRETVTLKRCRDDDADKDEEPSTGLDRGSKRRREGKEPECRQASLLLQKSLCRPPFRWKSPHIQSLTQKPPTPDRDWNKTLPANHESIQLCISDLAKISDSRSSFNELMDTLVDFSNFLINRLKVDTLTPELLAGPTYELLEGSCKSLVELEYHLEEVYKATIDQLEWVNPEGQQYPHNLLKPLPLIPNNRGRHVIPFDHFINNDLEYLRGGKLTNLTVEERFAFNVSLQMFTRSIMIQRRVEDLQLGVESYQKKLNLTKSDTYRSDLKSKEAYIAYSNPRGFMYQNKDKKNMLMRIDELHKFSDGALTDVCTALDDRLKGIRMQYLPQSIWRKSDKDKAAAMIQAIDKRLKTRRIMRSLERFVGGRLYEGDFRMLQRTNDLSYAVPIFQKTSNTLHNAIMEAGGKDRPSMLAPGNYIQWKSRINRYIDTKPNHELIHYCFKNPPYKYQCEDKDVPVDEGSTKTTTERFKQGESINVQDLETNLYWEFGKFTSRDGESLESYYSRANQDNSPRINKGTGYDNQKIGNVAGPRETVEQADWRDDTDDESEDQELEAHYMYMAQIQEVNPDAADNSRHDWLLFTPL